MFYWSKSLSVHIPTSECISPYFVQKLICSFGLLCTGSSLPKRPFLPRRAQAKQHPRNPTSHARTIWSAKQGRSPLPSYLSTKSQSSDRSHRSSSNVELVLSTSSSSASRDNPFNAAQPSLPVIVPYDTVFASLLYDLPRFAQRSLLPLMD